MIIQRKKGTDIRQDTYSLSKAKGVRSSGQFPLSLKVRQNQNYLLFFESPARVIGSLDGGHGRVPLRDP